MNILSSVFDVFTEVAEWIASTVPTISAMFYTAEEGLTLIGVLAVCGVAIATVLLVLNIVRSFLSFR